MRHSSVICFYVLAQLAFPVYAEEATTQPAKPDDKKAEVHEFDLSPENIEVNLGTTAYLNSNSIGEGVEGEIAAKGSLVIPVKK